MYNMNTMNNSMKNAQKGITLIESLVAIVVTALGILGILGVQNANADRYLNNRTPRTGRETYRRFQRTAEIQP